MTPLAIAAVGLFLAFTALAVLLLAPTADQRDARRRSEPPRYWRDQARRIR